MSVIKRYIGMLVKTSNGEEDELLGIVIDNQSHILAELINENMRFYGEFLTVRYYISDAKLSFDEIQESHLRKLFGDSEIKYDVAYSEYTGYLWTDEEITIGGHNLLEELKSNLGKYLYLEIDYHEEKGD